MTYKDQSRHLQQARRSIPSLHTLAMTSTLVHLPIYMCTSSSTSIYLQTPNHLCPHAPSGRPTVVHPQPRRMCLTPHASIHANRHVPPKPVSHKCVGSEPWHVGAHTPPRVQPFPAPDCQVCWGQQECCPHTEIATHAELHLLQTSHLLCK